MGKTVIKSFNGGKLAANDYTDRIILLMKRLCPQGVSAPVPGLYTCIKPLLSNTFFSEIAWPIKTKFYVEPPWEVGKKAFINGTGHMTKVAACLFMKKKNQKSSPTDLIVI